MALFFQIAMGWASELECYLLLTRDLDLLNNPDYEQVEKKVTEVKRMLASFVRKLRPHR